MDTHTPEQRSYNMSRIKFRDTSPELILRKYIWSKGLRGYRIKNKVTGKPDLYFSNNKIALFIDGCFWHKCPKCFVKPKSNNKYWDKKIFGNINRDKKINRELQIQGISVIRVWEHQIKEDVDAVYRMLKTIYDKKI